MTNQTSLNILPILGKAVMLPDSYIDQNG